ncbi:Mitochondrial ribonuclease P protein 3 [Liparis tanakae]|uniref:Mitochondrial ribonuclease P catalytic subunit n=1 Tax=Liparis tanakae TaxID=230148 RepID=A0A4Z2GZX6_9TELE|nr:Mitochondrial ribonuclease P protein 3 [Liparis tanakae]
MVTGTSPEANMGPALILQVRMCLKPFKPFFYQGSSTFYTLNTLLCKSPQLPLSARLLCTRHKNPTSGARQADRGNGGQADGQGGVRNSGNRRREEELWDGAETGKGQSASIWQRTAPLKSVFAAGTAKRTAEMLKRKALPDVEEHAEEPEVRTRRGPGKVQPPDRPLSAADWRTLKESLGNHPRFDIQMMGALFTSRAELDIAKSLLSFVAMETGTLTYELLLRYLTLCVSGGHDDEVFDVYDIMRGSFPCLETGASSLFIKSFSRTERWREAVGILREVKKVFTPSPRNYGDIIAAAMLNGDTAGAWALYDELIENGLIPHQETWEALYRGAMEPEEKRGTEAGAVSESEHRERLLGILLHMRNNQIYPQHGLTSSIKTWFERYRRAELERFKVFMERRPAFDVVVDGLNVANISRDKSKNSETLLAVVSELQGQGLNVLVLGRRHMLRPSRTWDKHNMKLIQQKAHCFFTENISEDDPFLLYATLNSGNHCRFVSRDLMRDHKACLPDGATRRLFFKWQRGHQLVLHGYVTPGRRVRFQSILSYDTIIQTSADSWHVPYDDTEDRCTYEVPQRWLCLTAKH